MEQLDQSGYELRKLHGSNTNAKYELKKMSKKKIVNGLFGINDLNENANNHFCSLNMKNNMAKVMTGVNVYY